MDSFAKCSFAHAGTYGHECGAPATKAGTSKGEHTVSSVYFNLRCDKCAMIKGGENAGVSNWQAFDPKRHVNMFKGWNA